MVSTYSRDGRKAIFFTVLFLLTATFLPVFLTVWYPSLLAPISATGYRLPLLLSPGYGIIQTIASGTPSGTFFYSEFSYWLSIVWQWLLAAALIALASAHVPHSWEESLKRPRVQILNTRARVKSRSPQGRAWLERNPFLSCRRGGGQPQERLTSCVFAILADFGVIAALSNRCGRVQIYDKSRRFFLCSSSEDLDCGGKLRAVFRRTGATSRRLKRFCPRR